MKKISINLILLLISTITINASQKNPLGERRSFKKEQIAHYEQKQQYHHQGTRFSKKQPMFNFVPTLNIKSSSRISQLFALVTIVALINAQGAIAGNQQIKHHINLNCNDPINSRKCEKFTELYNEAKGTGSFQEREKSHCVIVCEEDCFEPKSDTCLKCTCPKVCDYADNDLENTQLCNVCKKIGIIKSDGSLRPFNIITKECKAHCKNPTSKKCIQCNCKKECKKIKSLECHQCTCGYLCDTFNDGSCSKCYESILLKNK